MPGGSGISARLLLTPRHPQSLPQALGRQPWEDSSGGTAGLSPRPGGSGWLLRDGSGSLWSPSPKGGWVVWHLTQQLGPGELWGDERPTAVRRMRASMGARDLAGTHRFLILAGGEAGHSRDAHPAPRSLHPIDTGVFIHLGAELT